MNTARRVLCRLSENGRHDIVLRTRLFCIGSGTDNDLVVAGKNVPTLAVKIEPDGNGYHCSSGSGKPVIINGKKVRSAVLSCGDILTVGSEQLLFKEDTASQPGNEDKVVENLKRFIDAVGKERELHPLLKNLLRILLELTGGTDCFLFTLEPDGSPQLFESSGNEHATERFSDTIVQKVLTTKEGICISNALADPAFRNAHSIADLKLHSVLCVPMLTAGNFVGLVYIGSANPGVSFTQENLSVVLLYASIAGMLIHHVDFMTDQQRIIERLSGSSAEDGVIAGCPVMRTVIEAVRSIADADISVLLEGETGTGKNRIAELIHARSRRSGKPFVVVNCSALHGELLESELFGHKKGSFTGAATDHRGLFSAADGGTLLLDEIGELETPLQAKLLRTLETGTIRQIGSNYEQPVNVRMICATNRDLQGMVREGTFRSDLYYRINQFSIIVPPLRERGDDIELLALLLLDRLKQQYPDRRISGFTPASLRYMRTHPWPGNIRELANVLHRAVLMTTGPLVNITGEREADTAPDSFDAATRQFQKQLLERAIRNADGNKELAARAVGLSRSTFYRYLSQLM
ncbi:MAG: sigma 54-interacting transcriptional regulator [Chitinispirillaceae bacterium]|nr:sigma 54-interacting transcriptional regulator [Chitinispirillaceae bacterium]